MWFLYSKFKLKKWRKYPYEKRFKIFEALEKKVAKSMKLEPLKLELKYENDWGCFGAFMINNGAKKIVLNANLIEEPRYRFHAIETIAHETRHAYQFGTINRELKWYEFTAKRWKRNWLAYFSSASDNVMYNNQSIERDAQKFSIKFLKKLRGKYKHEPDWNETLGAVVYRYENAEETARKEYGWFYKYKIENNIKKKFKRKY